MRLSVLDQSPISEGSTGVDALANTLDLARLADQLGYHRYWVAEHHGGPMLASASPEALIGPIASAPAHLRVGSGRATLPHPRPLQAAGPLSSAFPTPSPTSSTPAEPRSPPSTSSASRRSVHCRHLAPRSRPGFCAPTATRRRIASPAAAA